MECRQLSHNIGIEFEFAAPQGVLAFDVWQDEPGELGTRIESSSSFDPTGEQHEHHHQ